MSLLTIAGAVAATVIFRGYSHNVLYKLRIHGAENQYGHIQIADKRLWAPANERIKDRLFSLSDEMKEKIFSRPDLVSASPRLSVDGLLTYDDEQFGVRLIGFDPKLEKTFTSTVTLVEGDFISETDENGVLIGAGVQSRLGVKIGDTVSVVAQTADGMINAAEMNVRGVFKTAIAEIDNQVAFIPLRLAQTLLETSGVELWILRLKNIEMASVAKDVLTREVSMLQPELAVKTWRDLAITYNKTKDFFEVQNAIVQTILATLTILAVFNSMGMTVYERTGEIGTLRSLGSRRSEITFLFLLEAVDLAVLGSLAGVVLSFVVASTINAAKLTTALPGASGEVLIEVDVIISAIVVSVSMAVVATLIGTLIPAINASRMKVIEALRRNI